MDISIKISINNTIQLLHNGVRVSENSEWVSESPKSLWKKIVDEVDDYYSYTLEWCVLYLF